MRSKELVTVAKLLTDFTFEMHLLIELHTIQISFPLVFSILFSSECVVISKWCWQLAFTEGISLVWKYVYYDTFINQWKTICIEGRQPTLFTSIHKQNHERLMYLAIWTVSWFMMFLSCILFHVFRRNCNFNIYYDVFQCNNLYLVL